MDNLDLGDLQSVTTLPALLRWRVRQTPTAEAYRQFDQTANRWRSYSWREIDAEFDRWRRALDGEGLSEGARVAILMPNGIAHIAMDQAALSRGLVPVPLHFIDNPESIIYILQDSGAELLLVDSGERWQTIVKAAGQEIALKRIVCANPGTPDADNRIVALDRWLDAAPATAAFAGDAADIKPHNLAAIVYTSGTTGRPKGVMLSHDNIIANIKAIAKRLPASHDDVFLSFLPLSHTFERTCGYYYAIAMGACVAYARSVKDLLEDLKTVKPTVLVAVPRIYERAYARIIERHAAAGFFERTVFDLAVAVGTRRFEARQSHLTPALPDRLLWPLLWRAVGAKVLEQFGGRLRFALTGSAPIGEPVIRLFLALGLDVLQGYSMTESSPVVSVNTPDDNDYRSVGHALDGIEVKLGDNQELLVRGANVMLGYWHRPEETARVKAADGWLHTGDQARIEDGRITITGRIKDILLTSTGEKIAPVDLESAILADPLFEQVMVIGEQRQYLAVLAVLDARAWQSERAKLASDPPGDTPPAQTALLLRHIAAAIKDFPAYATPHAVWWSTEPWTIDAGLLTPTLKNKRPAVEHRFAAEIENLYAQKPPAR